MDADANKYAQANQIKKATTLTTNSEARKEIPIQRGFLDYFPAAVAEVAKLSEAGNRKHNPGEDLHWARGKSMDHADCIARHQLERGIVDDDGFLHEVKVAWRAMAQLQEALEARGAPLARGARLAKPSRTCDCGRSNTVCTHCAGAPGVDLDAPAKIVEARGDYDQHGGSDF